MAHSVKVTITIPELSKVDTCYEIKQGTSKLGTLRVSKGGIEYIPKGNSTNTVDLDWQQFHNLLISKLP